MAIGASEAETFWIEFLRKLRRRGLAGVKLVISDAHKGIKAAVSKLFKATWQRYRVHFMRNTLATCRQERPARRLRLHRHRVHLKLPKLAALLDDAEQDVLAFMIFPKGHRAKIHSTNLIERLNREIKRRTEVVGISPSEEAITRLIGAILLE